MFNSSSYGHDPNFLPSFGPPNSAAAAAFFEGSPAFSSSPPYSSSLPSDNYFLHRRSNSTHSLTHQQQQQHYGIPEPTPPPFFSAASASPSSSAPCGFLDFHSEPVVRRVFSTGDLQGMNATQASTENSAQEASPAAGRVGRYSAEERRERIERYRNKRNQRNFHKKITYACRKTLADSRPRVRGRFARNGETEAEAEATEMIGLEGSCSNYNSCDTDAGNVDQLWRQMQAALATADEEEECCFDEDVLWASFDNVFSMNLLS